MTPRTDPETAKLLAAAQRWHDQDPDEETRAELGILIASAHERDSTDASAAIAELHHRFDTRLAFGTAGLRGELAAGPNRMNRVLVAQAAAGLAAYLRENAADGSPSVVIGYDGRKNSRVFARDTAELMAGAGVRATLLPRLLPTPVLAFAVRHLGASAGVMVTASHNPPNDNGYKVYLGGDDAGSQIVPPADARIADAILRAAERPIGEYPRSDDYAVADESVVDAYVARAAAAASAAGSPRHLGGTAPALRVVYTPMHGVGWETARRVFEAAGLPEPVTVPEQLEPDPAFTTVAFPNPEEPGAMDLAFRTGRTVAADLVIANDPDADRFAVAIPDPGSPEGYRRLSGNQVGAILGRAVAADADARGEHGTLAASLVSSPQLEAIARAHGHDFVETLTGFKWISRVPGLIYGFEEALGYLVNPADVRDKDGISAAALFVALAERLARRGVSVADHLAELAERFGAFASDQVSIRVTDRSLIARVMERLRREPPTEIGATAVAGVDDLIDGDGVLPPSDVLRFRLADGSRVVVRPSGTEPKLKIYIDAAADEGTAAEREATAAARVAGLRAGITAILED